MALESVLLQDLAASVGSGETVESELATHVDARNCEIDGTAYLASKALLYWQHPRETW